MRDNWWTYFFLIIFFFTCLFLFLWAVIRVMHEEIRRSNNERRNRFISNSIVPIHTLIRIAQERHNRERYIIDIEQYNNVMNELKNKVIIINPDETIAMGTKN